MKRHIRQYQQQQQQQSWERKKEPRTSHSSRSRWPGWEIERTYPGEQFRISPAGTHLGRSEQQQMALFWSVAQAFFGHMKDSRARELTG